MVGSGLCGQQKTWAGVTHGMTLLAQHGITSRARAALQQGSCIAELESFKKRLSEVFLMTE